MLRHLAAGEDAGGHVAWAGDAELSRLADDRTGRPWAGVEGAAQRTDAIATYEGARAHEQRFKEYGDRLDAVATMVRDGLKIGASEYEAARQVVVECRSQINQHYQTTPVILVPAATGPAPRGLASTGDSRMNSPWTALGTPAISIPMAVGDALPLGLQLTAQHGEDARVLRTAVRLAQLIGGRT